jgi:hypothetical protein
VSKCLKDGVNLELLSIVSCRISGVGHINRKNYRFFTVQLICSHLSGGHTNSLSLSFSLSASHSLSLSLSLSFFFFLTLFLAHKHFSSISLLSPIAPPSKFAYLCFPHPENYWVAQSVSLSVLLREEVCVQ